jgi:UDPglucose 6-dehydrogenase
VANICVIGTGYVGLSCGAGLNAIGHDVVCVDIDRAKVDMLNAGRIPIMEVGLEEIVQHGILTKSLSFTTNLKQGVESAEFVFLCLATPQSIDGSADLSALMGVVVSIAPLLKSGSVVITKSTVPIGTSAEIEHILNRKDVSVVSNPEFVREGSAVDDFMRPDRIVVGSRNSRTSDRVAAIYSTLDAPILMTDSASAEAIKHASNSFLAVKLSYINAMAIVCEMYGADVLDVSRGIGLDHRIGSEFLMAGPGWGGSCFPKDTSALMKMASSKGYEFGILREAIVVNEVVQNRIIEKITNLVGDDIRDKKIAVWGLTFKANTDDIRDSPSIEIVSRLLNLGAQIHCYDPTVSKIPDLISQARLGHSAEDACDDAELLVVLTEWPQFALVLPSQIASKMTSLQIFDCRNFLNRSQWIDAGFSHHGVGR